MKRRVLDVGNCDPDHASIVGFLQSHFDVDVERAHLLDDTLAALRARSFDLVLVNRKLDQDYSDGIEIIRHLKGDPQFAEIPAMLVTNLSDHQCRAVALGAELGFGKLEFKDAAVIARLVKLLGSK